MKNKLYYSTAILILVFSSCNKDIGEQIQTRIQVPEFYSLRQDAATDIVLLQGSNYAVDFEGSDIILGDLDFRVVNQILVITQHGHYGYSGHSTIYITVPDLISIENSGSGDIYNDSRFRFKGEVQLIVGSSGDIDLNIDAPALSSYMHGSGDLRLRGYADDHFIEHDGFGTFYGFNLQTDKTNISQYSSGNAEIQVRNYFKVRLRGSGDIYFIGSPFVDYFVPGSGRLIDSN
ncbi:MAG: head GIN domain-containing protein [Saprospiraceae bacterium]